MNRMTIRMTALKIFAGAGLAVYASALPFAGSARAADASPWVKDANAAVRLIAGSGRADGNRLRAGVEIKMTPGWHTYWRYPGDAGMPPRFDFAGSSNLAGVEVRYPAPHLLADETGNSIGYIDKVVFPMRVTPREPGKPVTLRLKLDYAVCEKLCMPVEARLELDVTGAASGNDATLATAEARVPKPAVAAELGLSARRVNDGPKPLVAIELKAPAGKPSQLFVEGPTPEWALPVPKPAQNAPAGQSRFVFELDGLPPGANSKDPAELTVTVVQGDKAFETRAKLD